MIHWTEWPLWLTMLWARLFVGCPSNHWTHHPTPRHVYHRRWWGV